MKNKHVDMVNKETKLCWQEIQLEAASNVAQTAKSIAKKRQMIHENQKWRRSVLNDKVQQKQRDAERGLKLKEDELESKQAEYMNKLTKKEEKATKSQVDRLQDVFYKQQLRLQHEHDMSQQIGQRRKELKMKSK